MNPRQLETYVGVDIGGTYCRLAIVDAMGRVLADRREATPTGADGEDLVTWLDETYHLCRGETDSYPAPIAIGVGVPGVLEPGRAAVIRAVNLPYIEGLPLRDRLIERTGLPAMLDCDTVTAGWGEFCALEKRPKRMAYMTIGTGVGVAIIIDGKVLRHTHHSAGHFGHVICDTSEGAPLCRCGLRGCLESLVAGPRLRGVATEMGIEGTFEEIEAAVQGGNAMAVRFIDAVAPPLVTGLCNLVHLYAVDTVVIGGGAASSLPSLVHRAEEHVHGKGSTLFPQRVSILPSALDQYSGVVGAALLAAETIRAGG